jgi:hypothetical protein
VAAFALPLDGGVGSSEGAVHKDLLSPEKKEEEGED